MTKIDDIFANETLFAVRYTTNEENELKRLLNLWSNPAEVYNFVKKNAGDLLKNNTIEELTQKILEEAEYIDNTLNQLKENAHVNLDDFFLPLNASDTQYLGKKKGKKVGFTFLRLYAIKIEDNCYLITGGAIKLTSKMGESEDTLRQIGRLDIWRADLDKQGVSGKKEFFEYVKEQSHE